MFLSTSGISTFSRRWQVIRKYSPRSMPRSSKNEPEVICSKYSVPREVVVVEDVDDQVLDDDDVARVEPLGDGLLLVLGEYV